MLGTEESVCARAHSPHLRPRHHSQTELGVDQRGSRLGEVALVRQQAASAETTRTAQLEGGQTANLQTGFLSLLSTLQMQAERAVTCTLWKYLVHLGFRWPYGSSDFGLKTPMIFCRRREEGKWGFLNETAFMVWGIKGSHRRISFKFNGIH